jgi:hypothetical protein
MFQVRFHGNPIRTHEPMTEPDALIIQDLTLLHRLTAGTRAVIHLGWADTPLRVARLADDLPEVTDLDLNPVIARPDGAFAVDARVKVAPCQPTDPFLRDLR